VKRVGRGFRNFDNYRLWLVLAVGLAHRPLAGFACHPDPKPLTTLGGVALRSVRATSTAVELRVGHGACSGRQHRSRVRAARPVDHPAGEQEPAEEGDGEQQALPQDGTQT
jgi:hypothetical protein